MNGIQRNDGDRRARASQQRRKSAAAPPLVPVFRPCFSAPLSVSANVCCPRARNPGEAQGRLRTPVFPDISHDVDHARVARNMRALKYVTIKQANVSSGVCLPRAVSPGLDSVSEGKQHVRPFTSPSVPICLFVLNKP